MEDVNKQRRNFVSLSELEYGPLKFSFFLYFARPPDKFSNGPFLSVPNCTHIVTLFTFIFRFSSLNLVHMNYSDYTDTIFTLSNDDATILEQRKDNSSGAFIVYLNINSIQNKFEELKKLETL